MVHGLQDFHYGIIIKSIEAGVSIIVSEVQGVVTIEQKSGTVFNIQGSVTVTEGTVTIAGGTIVVSQVQGDVTVIQKVGTTFNIAGDVNITNSVLNVNIGSISSGVVFNANITGSVTLNVNVTNAVINTNINVFPFENWAEDILDNPGFETGDKTGWSEGGYGSWVVQSTTKYGGSYAAQLNPNINNWHQIYTTKYYPCHPGQVVEFSCAMKADANIVRSHILFVWSTIEKTFITSTYSPDYGGNYDWTRRTFRAVVPDGIAFFRPVIRFYSGSVAGVGYVDSCHLARRLEPALDTNLNIGVSINAQTISTLKIDIASATIGNLNVNIKASEAIVNIATQGGKNIIIDKLVQGAVTERRETISNNGATATITTSNLTNKRGKFFPRGCRGFIDSIEIYCDNTDTVNAHTLTIKISPNPGLGYVITATLSIPANSAAAWRSVSIKKYWNYDSLFIWVSSDSDTYGGIGYDAVEVFDSYYSTDEVTWNYENRRYWFRVIYTALTVGDIPISGIVDTIEIPHQSVSTRHPQVSVSPNAEVYVPPVYGSGKLLFVVFEVWTTLARDYMIPRIKIDDQQALPFECSIGGFYAVYVGENTPGITIGKWDTTNNYYSLVVTLNLPFKRKIEFGWKNGHTTSTLYGDIAYIVEKIS